jgi:excisionase family DNA binding protein
MRDEPIAPLLLSASDAAKALAISERTLFSLTKCGEIPCVRIGRCVRYSIQSLSAFLQRNEVYYEAIKTK